MTIATPAVATDETDPSLVHALHEVLVCYARLCDERDWSRLPQVFAPEARAQYGALKLADPAAIERMLRRALGGCGPTQHLLGNLTVTTAQGPCSRITVRALHLGAGAQAGRVYECMGEYHDQWRLTADGWRIVQRQMVVAFELGSRDVLQPA